MKQLFLNKHLILHLFVHPFLTEFNVSVNQLELYYSLMHRFMILMKSVSQAVKLFYILQVLLKIWPTWRCHHRLCDIFTFVLAGQFSQDNYSQKKTVFPSAVIYFWPPYPSHMHPKTAQGTEQDAVKTDTMLIKSDRMKEGDEAEVGCKVAGSARELWED